MAILVTGGSGFLGTALVKKLAEEKVYTLSRTPPEPLDNLTLQGDILKENLGLEKVPEDIERVYHLAGIVKLGKDRDGSLWRTNVDGTKNVIDLCLNYDIPHLFFCSTAYTQGRNPYEESKAAAEHIVACSKIPRITIIKPSIIIGSPDNPGPAQNINQWAGIVLRIVKIHQKAEAARRQVQDKLALPPLELGLRIEGDPDSTLSLIPVDVVAAGIIGLGEGTYYLTNPNPPTVQEVADEIGEAISLNIHIMKKFRPSPVERTLHKLLKPFIPYMLNELPFHIFVADLPHVHFRLPRGYIRDTITSFLH